MIKFGELGIELKSGILFSTSALIFSIIAGLAGGVPAFMVFLRSLMITPVFFIVGFGIILVIKKFVPEVYEILQTLKASSEDSVGKVDISLDTSENINYESREKTDSGFSEFTENDYERLQTVRDSDKIQAVRESESFQKGNDSSLDGVLNASGGKLGKHIIVENKLNSYEPKLMAQAVRTMMSKDKD